MNKRKSGFTLMEIMVVIIVIAVLASVAGPMIGSITDQGRASATKSKMSSLKSALLAYQSDVGRLPYTGKNSRDKSAYCADSLLSPNTEDNNVLYSNSLNGYGADTTQQPNNYSRKWKGPYMDSDPSDFMVDSWGNNIRYQAFNKNVYLWSAGPDCEFETANLDELFKMQTNGSDCDDIVISVYRAKKSFL
jgi:prepilin-type N-terminal cleavage/methylation domain-containing protein